MTITQDGEAGLVVQDVESGEGTGGTLTRLEILRLPATADRAGKGRFSRVGSASRPCVADLTGMTCEVSG